MSVNTPVSARQINDSARIDGRRFARRRYRLVLSYDALAAVEHGAQIIRGRKSALVMRAQLGLFQCLARVVGEGISARLSGVGGQLRAGQAQWVIRVWHVDGIGDQREFGLRIELPDRLGVHILALSGAVIAVTIGVE